MLIDNQMSKWGYHDDSDKVIALTDNLTNHAARIDFTEYADIIFGEDKQMAVMTVNYQDSLLKLIDDSEFKELFYRFSDNFNSRNNLVADRFAFEYNAVILDNNWIDQLFSVVNSISYKKAWKKYYKLYPHSPGYFEFSKIEYSDNYGLLYWVHRAKPLIGGGKLVVLKKYNNNWITYDFLTIWFE
jgi:hypothetical protein